MRTILFSTERVTSNNWETGLFILFLLVFAVAASAYVLFYGLQVTDCHHFQLFAFSTACRSQPVEDLTVLAVTHSAVNLFEYGRSALQALHCKNI